MLFPVFILREAGSVRPSKCIFTQYIWLCSFEAGLGLAVLAGTELPEIARQGAKMRPPVVAMGDTKEVVLPSASSGYQVGLAGKGLWGKGCSQSAGLMDREVRGGSVLCSDSSSSRPFL